MLYEGRKEDKTLIEMLLTTPDVYELAGNNLKNYDKIEVKVRDIDSTQLFNKFVSNLPQFTEKVLNYITDIDMDGFKKPEYIISGIALIPKRDRIF